jgi:hypothetical protein
MPGSILFLASFQTIVKSKYSARVFKFFKNIDMGTSVIVERAF